MHKTNLRHAPLIFVSAMIFFIAVIVFGGYQSFRYQRESMKQEIRKDLNTIANLKTDQIVQWRSERFGYAGVIGENHILPIMLSNCSTNRKIIIYGKISFPG